MSETPGVEANFEPDNEKERLSGFRAKTDLPRFPLLRPGDVHHEYAQLWRHAFTAARRSLKIERKLSRIALRDKDLVERWIAAKEAGDRPPQPAAARALGHVLALSDRFSATPPTSRTRIVKSVHGVLSAEWIVTAAEVGRVLVVLRSPFAILASWRRMDLFDRDRPACHSEDVLRAAFGSSPPAVLADDHGPLQKMALQLVVQLRTLLRAVERNPQWCVVCHEELCTDPKNAFEALSAKLGLPWSESVARAVDDWNRAGSGYQTARISDQEIGKWRKSFSTEDVAAITGVFRACGLQQWSAAVDAHSVLPALLPKSSGGDVSAARDLRNAPGDLGAASAR